MKRVTIILSCLALVLSLAVPCLAVDFDPRDYIETEYVGEEITTLEVSIPWDAFTGIHWIAYDTNTPESWQNPYAEEWASSFDLLMNGDGSAPEGYSIDCSPFARGDYIAIKDFVNGTEVSVDFSINGISDWAILEGMEYRYQIYFFDYQYQRITVEFSDFASTEWFDQNEISFILNKPDGAMYMTFILQFRNVYQEMYDSGMENNLNLNFNAVNFTCDVATMKTQEQLTGETNRLLEKLMNGYTPKPIKPGFGDSMADAIIKEDSLVDMFPDGTLENFGGNVAGLMDSLLLYAGAFGLIKAIWDPFIALEWFNIILTASLALGLLGAVLGTFLTTSKASNHDGKGKD